MGYHQTCRNLRDDIRNQMHITVIRPQSSIQDNLSNEFLTHNGPSHILRFEKLRDWYKAFIDAYPENALPQLDPSSFATRIEETGLHAFFAVLIYARCGPVAVQCSIKTLLCPDSSLDSADKGKLPLSSDELIILLGADEEDVSSFLKTQAPFCTVVLERGNQVSLERLSAQRLPYLEQTQIGGGTFGTVYKVKIAAGHLRDNSNINDIPVDVARKDCRQRSYLQLKHEWEINQQIFQGDSHSDYILNAWGSLSIGGDRMSLFMELADCDLHQYMNRGQSAGQEDLETKIRDLNAAVGVARGLDFLHKGIRQPRGDLLQCVHMDLKPTNILVKTGQNGEMRWKISDFGMSRIKPFTSTANKQNDSRPATTFIETPSDLTNPPGHTSFRAPETIGGGKGTSSKTDIWSLGCILSVLFVYLYYGGTAVDKYARRRGDRNKAVSGSVEPTFFTPQRSGLGNYVLNKIVYDQHSSIRRCEEGFDLKHVLAYLENELLGVKKERRPEALAVSQWLDNKVASEYKRLGKEQEPNPLEQKGVGHFRRISNRFQGIFAPGPSPTRTCKESKSWPISWLKLVSDCHVDFGMEYVAFWTKDGISLLLNNSELPEDGNWIEKPPVSRLAPTSQRWTCVRASRQYLVATTSERSFRCYVFDFLKPNTPRGPNLQSMDVLSLPVPRIHTLAVSPLGERLACVVGDDDDEQPRQQPCIYYATTGDLFHALDRNRSQVEKARLWKSCNIGPVANSAKDIVELEFISEDSLYFVTTRKTGEGSVAVETSLVLAENLESGSWRTLRIPRPDLSYRDKYLIEVVPMPVQKKIAILLEDSTLSFHSYAESGSKFTEAGVVTIKGFKIAKLMLTQQGDRMIGLARSHDNSPWVIIEIPINDEFTGEVYPWKIKKLDNFYTSIKSWDGLQMRFLEDPAKQVNPTERVETIIIATGRISGPTTRAVCRAELSSYRSPG